jgi:hypothetical protein
MLFHLAGGANDPFLAKAERLADLLARRFPDVAVEKHMVEPGGWRAWLQGLCKVGAGGMTGGSGLLRVVPLDRGDQRGSNGV